MIDVSEAAEYLKLKASRTILRYVADARNGCDMPIPYFQRARGGPLLFLKSELLKWLRDIRIKREIETRRRR